MKNAVVQQPWRCCKNEWTLDAVGATAAEMMRMGRKKFMRSDAGTGLMDCWETVSMSLTTLIKLTSSAAIPRWEQIGVMADMFLIIGRGIPVARPRILSGFYDGELLRSLD